MVFIWFETVRGLQGSSPRRRSLKHPLTNYRINEDDITALAPPRTHEENSERKEYTGRIEKHAIVWLKLRLSTISWRYLSGIAPRLSVILESPSRFRQHIHLTSQKHRNTTDRIALKYLCSMFGDGICAGLASV